MATKSLPKDGIFCCEMPHPLGFVTTPPPVIRPGTIVVAAAAPDVEKGHPDQDGWLLSDFYAFNYLPKGVGGNQAWLTAADPLKLTQAGPHTGRYLHGNPSRDRKIVLSKKLLDANELTPVVLVRSDMTSRFLEEVHAASRRAVKNQVSLLLSGFCHTPGTIAKTCHTTLYSTACYSGGWIVRDLTHPERMPLDDTMLDTAKPKAMFDAWQNSPSIIRACGSIFANAVIDTLTSLTSPLLESGDRDGKLSVDKDDEQQSEAYQSFCHSVLDIRSGHSRHFAHLSSLTINAPDDQWDWNWTQRSGILLTCPGDWNSGWGPLTRGCLRAFVAGNTTPDPDIDVAAMMAFRWGVSLLADCTVRYFNLAAPNNEPCIMWDSAAWTCKAPAIIPDYEERHEDAWSALRNAGVEADPSDVQGPPFGRFAEYLTVAVSNLSREASLSVTGEMGEFMQRIRQFSMERNLEAAICSDSVIAKGCELWEILGSGT
ncbi:hypothetical protein CDEST_11998 [Colletotrichum destructivum]|uniref:Uncharacterized protein n=1 Tax=Colletotrichum destructivum TaxID=34406 RepID=A0AAX4IUP8_9PEZI|nr:hypothetical protein CDEST_11998 [Colletotrichum destructivum]